MHQPGAEVQRERRRRRPQSLPDGRRAHAGLPPERGGTRPPAGFEPPPLGGPPYAVEGGPRFRHRGGRLPRHSTSLPPSGPRRASVGPPEPAANVETGTARSSLFAGASAARPATRGHSPPVSLLAEAGLGGGGVEVPDAGRLARSLPSWGASYGPCHRPQSALTMHARFRQLAGACSCSARTCRRV